MILTWWSSVSMMHIHGVGCCEVCLGRSLANRAGKVVSDKVRSWGMQG